MLEGRTDNTIKNHWNSSMRKLVSFFEKEFDAQCRKYCAEQGVTYQGNDVKKIKSLPQSYQRHIRAVEEQIKAEKLESVRISNEGFYMMKAKEYLDKKDDPISYAQAELLLKKLNKTVKDIFPDHTPLQERGGGKLDKQNTRPTTISANNKHNVDQTSQRVPKSDLFNQNSKCHN